MKRTSAVARRLCVLVWALAMALVMVGCEDDPMAAAIFGTVTAGDAAGPSGAQPVPGVTVNLVDLGIDPEELDPEGQPKAFIASTQTDQDGAYGFEDLAPGSYEVLAMPSVDHPWFDRAPGSDEGPLVFKEDRSSEYLVDFAAQVPSNALDHKCRCSVGCGFSTIFYFICWPICCASCYQQGTYEHKLCFGFDPDF